MIVLFWLLFFSIIYCYFGYPALLWAAARIFPRPVAKSHEPRPGVSVVLSIWNEEDVIARKIKNLLALDYPGDLLEIIVGSDASSDRTDEIVRGFSDPRLRFVASPRRRGKMATINDLVALAKHQIIVFSDARQILAPDAVKELVANFHDPRVGCVSGELMLSRREGATSRGINVYWDYEKWIRKNESRLHSMLGATGAIYAVRRELFVPAPAETILDDMYVPCKIIEKGYRAIFDETAKAYDEVASTAQEEYRRKARTLSGNFQIFRFFPGLLVPGRSPVAVQMFSHKFLRLVMPFCLLALLAVNLALWEHPTLRGLGILQIVFYGAAIMGGLARNQKYGILNIISKGCYVPYVFCLLNFSALIGFLRFVTSSQKITWEKARKNKT